MSSNTSFTKIVGYLGEDNFPRSTDGDALAYDTSYALWAFAHAWNGENLPAQPPELNDIPPYDRTYFNTSEPLSYSDLFKKLEDWCLQNYKGTLETTFPDILSFFRLVADKWYMQTGLSTEDVPDVSHWLGNTDYETSFLNISNYYIAPPFYYTYTYRLPWGITEFQISNKVLVPIQRRGIDGKVKVIDTYPNLIQETASLTFYRLLQLILSRLSYEGSLFEVKSRDLNNDFYVLQTILSEQNPDLVVCDFTNFGQSSVIKTFRPSNVITLDSLVLVDKVRDYIKSQELEFQRTQKHKSENKKRNRDNRKK